MTAPDWHRLPSLSSLRAFEAAARLGGFSAAARALNVTHAAVSQAVRGLEAELGTALLRRDGRGLALTDEGERLSRALRDGFGTIAAGVEALRGAEKRRGLRVTATPSFAQQVLLPRLGDFWARHPDIAVSISVSLAIADLAREGLDLAIRIGDGQWSGTVAEPLMKARLLLVGAPTLLARGEDLARLPWIVDPADPNEAEWLRGGGLDAATLPLTGLDNPLLALAAARAGYGLLFASDVAVREDLAAGRLCEVPFAGLPHFSFWIVTLPGPRRPVLQSFVAWLRREFGEDTA